MAGFTLIYLLCLASGVSIASRLPLNNLLERTIVVVTAAAGQLLIAIQCLSLVTRLNGTWLIVANVLLTALVWGAAWFWSPPRDWISWRTLLTRGWQEITTQKKEPVVVLLLALALIATVVHCSLGALMIPLGDSYHYEMPLFWAQHQTLDHFPVNNPRINCISFLGEALTLPGFLYLHSSVMFAVITFVAALLGLGVVFALARSMGCSPGASAGAAAITLAFTDFALNFLVFEAGHYLLAMWVGASLLFLIGSRPSGNMSPQQLTRLGCSVFCFLMACGAKNTVVFLAPLYLTGLVAALERFIVKRQVILVMVLCGGLASLSSGLVWNYVSNQLWYGDSRGPKFMQGHLSGDFGFRAIWTRECRGAVLVALDTMWIPQSARAAYAGVCEKAVEILGGQGKLAEDNGFNTFNPEDRRPLKGCGWVGPLFLLPGLIIAAGRCLGIRRFMSGGTGSTRFAIALLLLFVVGSFVIPHAALRWQRIGLLRLMPAFSILAAPFCALVLERKWLRVAALAVLLASTAVFVTYDLSMIGRRFDTATQNRLFGKILRLGTQHGMTVQYQWKDQPPGTFFTAEDYTARGICQKFLEYVPSPTVIGYAGEVNGELVWLFGPGYRNKVIPLVDDRKPDQLLDPPADVEYVLVSGRRPEADAWASQQGFQPVFQAVSTNGSVAYWFVAFEKKVVKH
jgi:hypothetical protein